MPAGHVVAGTQPAEPPHTPGVPPPPHVCGAVQVPQSNVPPQPSPCWPQLIAIVAQSAVVFGTQPAVPPHTLGAPPPPHVCGAVQVPHSSSPPHPSATGPQFTP